MTTSPRDREEIDAVARRYARRPVDSRYSLLNPDVWQTLQERQRVMLGLFKRLGWNRLDELHLLEVGCGAGGNLLELLRAGFSANHLLGAELLPQRCAQARAVLPEAVKLWQGDALQLELAEASQDIVFVSTVFSSLLDDPFQERLAHAMWRWTKPGGGVLWYDFIVNNPRNPDVRGVPLRRLRELFPHGTLHAQRVTLAPPIARAVTRVHPALYTLFNSLPALRTHVFAWIAKP